MGSLGSCWRDIQVEDNILQRIWEKDNRNHLTFPRICATVLLTMEDSMNDPQIAALAQVSCEEVYPIDECPTLPVQTLDDLEAQIRDDEDAYGWGCSY